MKTFLPRIHGWMIIVSLIWGCASWGKISERFFLSDTFSRIYNLNFSSFHPQLNSFLQDYAQKNKGNSFQIRRLGSDEVVWRGILKMKNSIESFSVEISAKALRREKSQLELKFLGDHSQGSSASWKKASAELFHALEKGVKISFP